MPERASHVCIVHGIKADRPQDPIYHRSFFTSESEFVQLKQVRKIARRFSVGKDPQLWPARGSEFPIPLLS